MTNPPGDPDFFRRVGGKYDSEAQRVQQRTGGGVILFVTGGKRGSGVSITSELTNMQPMILALRAVADQMEADIKATHRKYGN